MTYHLAERNERQGRFHALVLAVTLHLALAAVLYLYTSGDTALQLKKNEPAKIERPVPQPKAKA
jgi:hypothetical protein